MVFELNPSTGEQAEQPEDSQRIDFDNGRKMCLQ
jgi:hypothetical protein